MREKVSKISKIIGRVDKTRLLSVGSGLLLILGLFVMIMGSQPPESMSSDCIVPAPGLISWWPGDGNASDIIGGYHGASGTFVPGKVDWAFSFDGTTDSLVSIPDDDIWTLGDKSFTIDLWVYFNVVKNYSPFIAHDEGPGSLNKWIFWYSQYSLFFHINSPSGGCHVAMYPWNPNPATWYHVAITRSDSTYALYIDGIQVCTELNSRTIPNPDGPLTIGGAENRWFLGLLDEVEIFNRALSASEIQAIYNAGSAGKCKDQIIAVIIDIKPGSYPNSINIGSHGNVPVAILGSAELDAATVNPLTVTLAGAAVRMKGKGTPMYSFDDVNGDGIIDMIVHVETEALELATYDEDAVLEGQTYDGKKIMGTDTVRIVQE